MFNKMSTQVIVAGPRNGITVKKIEDEIFKKPLERPKSGMSVKGKKNTVIEGLDFRGLNEDGGKQLAISDCEELTIRRCAFGKKTTLGVALNITGAKLKRVIVEYCLFEDMTYTESNGGEPCRLGNSQFSGCVFESTVRKSIFRNLKSDPEAISIKSVGNTVEDCFFIANNANVTVRHGGMTTIHHNYFQTSGGIRLHGYGNKVKYNAFENFGTNERWAPIILRYGNSEKDPNFTSVSKPSGKSGNSHAMYSRTVDNEIDGNEFKNCKITIIELEKGANLKPTGTKTGKNPTVKEFRFGKVPEPEIIVEPTTQPQPPVVMEEPDPEPEQPVVTPQPDDVKETQMCGIRRHEEARVHLHIYACPEHATSLRQKFRKILEETEREFEAEDLKLDGGGDDDNNNSTDNEVETQK